MYFIESVELRILGRKIAHFATRSVVPAHVHLTAGTIYSVLGCRTNVMPRAFGSTKTHSSFLSRRKSDALVRIQAKPPLFFNQELGPVP